MSEQNRPDITFDLTVMVYRKAEKSIGILSTLSMCLVLIGVFLLIFSLTQGSSILQTILVSIWPITSGIFALLIFSSVETYIKATRCKFMLENNHLRDVRAENN